MRAQCGPAQATMQAQLSTLTIARRSLAHFAFGRTLGAAVGLASLLLLVRALARDDYGLYIALLAAFEIVQIAASPGAHAVVFRFVPELRSPPAAPALARLVLGVSCYGLLTLGLAAAVLGALAEGVATLLGAPHQGAALRAFALVMIFEGMARLLDAQFESLLEQGLAQLSALLRNGLRLLALALLSGFGSHEVTLPAWVAVEAFTTAVGLCVAAALMAGHLRRALRSSRAGLGAAPPAAHEFALSRWWHYAGPSWAAHLVGVASGVEMVKLLLSKGLGAAAAAPFGFAAALAGTLQRYLPSILLVGWLRPLLISAHAAGRPAAHLVALAGTLLKLNVLVLAPLGCLVAVAGAPLVQLLSGGRLPEALPILVFFMLLLVLQTLRTVVALLGVTMELGLASLQATLASTAGLALGAAAFPWLGLWAFCLGLAANETIWTLVMLRALRGAGLRFVLPWPGLARLGASAAVAAMAGSGGLAVLPGGAGNAPIALAAGVVAALACLAVAARLRPFAADERELINRLLPWRLFVW